MGLREDLQNATWDWFKASLKEFRGSAEDDEDGRNQRDKLTDEVRRCLREFFSRYLRARVMELMPDSTREERARVYGDLLPQLESHLNFFSKSCTQSIQGDFLNIGEELEEADPPDHRKYILGKIETRIDEFIDASEQLAEALIDRDLKPSGG